MHFPVKKIYGNIGYNMCEVMHVVVISQVRRVRALAYVYADGSLFLRIAWKHFQKNPLREGDVIDPEAYTDQLAAAQFKDAYEAALTCLDRSERTGSDLTRALVYKGYVPPAAEAAVARLTEAGLVDDLRYASRLAESAAGKPVGRYALRRKMMAKGISEADIESAMESLDDDQQRTAARQAAEKLGRKYRDLPPLEARAKLSQALARRGFSWDVISSALEDWETE